MHDEVDLMERMVRKYQAGVNAPGTVSDFLKEYGSITTANILAFYQKIKEKNNIDCDKSLALVEEGWLKHGDEVLERLKKIFNCDADGELTVCLSLSDMSWMTEDRIYITYLAIDPMRVLIHELLHFYVRKVLPQALSQEKIDSASEQKKFIVKESLTAIINLEFYDLIELPDIGYKPHWPYRKIVNEMWKKEKNIIKIIQYLDKLTV